MSRPSPTTLGFRLLSALDDLVAMDVSGPGFAGRMAIGVRDSDTRLWWVADFASRTVTTRFDETCPNDATFTLQMGVREAEQTLLRGLTPTDADVALDGDPALFDVFIGRYLEKHDQVGMRATQGRP